MTRTLALRLLLGLSLLTSSSALAQEVFEEEPDATRLDVERLPPEAIELSREMYETGFFFESHFGVMAFLGGVGRYATPGFYMEVGMGYEFAPWFAFLLSAEASIHQTDAPSPPDTTVFEVVSFLGSFRFNFDINARHLMYLQLDAGVDIVTSDVLLAYGLDDSDEVGFVGGGQLGWDFHLKNPHGSIGLASGARVYTNLRGQTGEMPIGVVGSGYLKYVF